MIVFLVGYMGAGKTTVASKLARRLGWKFYDIDRLVEEKQGKTLDVIFDEVGETGFRIMERDMLDTVVGFEDCVIATGGGMPCFYDNMARMNRSGITVYLEMHPNSLHHRLLNAKKTRPLLGKLRNGDLREYIYNQLNEREKYYRQARIVQKGENLDLDALVDKIMQMTGHR